MQFELKISAETAEGLREQLLALLHELPPDNAAGASVTSITPPAANEDPPGEPEQPKEQPH